MVDVDFADHTERRIGFLGSNLGSNEVVAVRCELLHWFMGRGLGHYKYLRAPETSKHRMYPGCYWCRTHFTVLANEVNPSADTSYSSINHPV